jgi:hypothetical protein
MDCRGRSLDNSRDFSLRHFVQRDSGVHAHNYPIFILEQDGQGVKLTSHFHLLLRLILLGDLYSVSQHVFTAWCLIKHRKDIIFTVYMRAICLAKQIRL